MTDPKEAELVRRCVQGSPGGWEEFHRRYRRLVGHAVRQAFRYYGGKEADPADEENLCGTVFLKLLEGERRLLREFEGNCALSTWLYLVVSRLARDHLRSAGRELRKQETYGSLLSHLKGASSSPIDRLSAQERAEWLRKGLNALAPKERRILLELYWQDRPYAEVARRESIPVGTLATRVAAVKRKLFLFLRDALSSLLL